MERLKDKFSRVNRGTVLRTLTLVLAIANQVVAVIGASSFADALWYQILSIVVTAVTAAVNAWENNDWTYFARVGTGVLDALEAGTLSVEQVRELLESQEMASGKSGKALTDKSEATSTKAE